MAEYYQNPILNCDFSDPDAIRVGEDYYMIASSFTYLPGVPILHSRNLVHWERIGYCVRELPFKRYEKPAHGCGTWAPALRYQDGRFYAFIPLPDEGIFVTTALNPAGEWSPLRCIRKASGWIDPCPLWDEDGTVYMAHAFANSRCGIKHKIQISRLNPETLEVVEDGPVVFDGEQTQPTAEGPKLYKRNGWYYIFIPAGGVKTGWQTVLRSREIYGPYEEKIVLHQGNTDINGPHQGAWVDTPDGENWFLHFQEMGTCGRVVHLQPLCWREDWPFIGQELNGDGIGEPVREWRLPGKSLQASEKMVRCGWSRQEVFGLQWQWQANPKPEWRVRGTTDQETMELAVMPGNGTDVVSLWEQPNVLSQMIPSPDFRVEVTLEQRHSIDGERVGAGILGMTYSAVELIYESGGSRLCLLKGDAESDGPTAAAVETTISSVEMAGAMAEVILEIKGGSTVQYFYRKDGIVIPLGPALPVSPGVWTGARLAVFVRGVSETPKGTGIFRNFGLE